MNNRELRTVVAAVLALALLAGIFVAPAARAQTTFANSGCAVCHAATGARINAANAGAVIVAAYASHVMGSIGATNINSVAADLGTTFGAAALTQTNAVNYQSVGNSIAITSLVIDNPGAVITTTALVGANGGASRGTASAGTPNSLDIGYSHTASNCSSDTITVLGAGSANTANRTVTVTISDPGAPTANSYTAATIAYSTGITTLTAPTLGGPAPRTLAIVAQPAAGTGTASVSGTNLRYASPATYVPQATFTYNAVGPCVATYPGTATSATRTVTVNITAPTPTTLNPTTAVPFNAGGAGPTAINIPALIGAVTGVVTGVSITTPPTAGVANVVGTTVNYTPNALNATGDSFAYSTTGPGLGFSGTVTITIAPAVPPTVAGSMVTVPFNPATNPQPPAATPVPLSITGFATAVNIVTPPANGTLLVSGTTVSYRPNANFFGPDSFVYTAQSLFGTSPTSATVNITVTAPGLPAVASSSTSVPFNPATNPQPPPATPVPLSISGFFTAVNVVTPPANGTLVPAGTSMSYRPNPNYFGPDSFVYNAQSPVGTSPTNATVSLTVAAPAAPTAANRNATVAFNTATPIDLSASITGLVASIAITTAPTKGTTSIVGNIVTYTPTTGSIGTDSFAYTATAPGGAVSAPAIVSITISNQLPTVSAAAMTVDLNRSGTLDLLPFIAGSAISGVAIAAAPAHGTVTVNGTKVTYTPVKDYFGSDQFSYTAFGNAGASTPAVVTVTVVGRPDPTQQQNVIGMVAAQIDTAQRMAGAQIANFGRRLESLRSGGRAASAAQRQGQAPAVASAPSFVDPFSELPAGPASGAGNRIESSIDSRVARTGTGTTRAAPNSRSFEQFEQAAARAQSGAFGFAPARESTDQRSPPLGHLAAAASAQSTQVDALGAPLRVNGGGLASDLVNMVASRSVNLAQVTGSSAAAQPSSTIGDTDIWIEGSVNWGNRGAAGNGGTIDFSTSGISFGIDRRFSENLVLGVGGGFARDRTEIGTDGSKNEAHGGAVAIYGSYQPTPNTFVDAVIGAGKLDFDNERFVAPIGALAKSDRDGSQIFASIAAGYEHRRGSVLISPYGRLDLSYDRFKDSTETGVGNFALHYFDERIRSVQGAVGLRLESVHATSFGWMAPRARIELRHSFDGDQNSQIAYADLIGTRYTLSAPALERSSVLVGVGGEFHLHGGLSLGVEYQLQKADSEGSSQGIRFRLMQALDGKATSRPAVARATEAYGAQHHDSSDIRVDLGWTHDDNVTRGRLPAEVLRDTSVNFAANKVELFPLSDNARLMLVGSIGGDKFHSYNGLDRVFAALRGELQYRLSGEFDAPIVALFGRFTGEQFESQLRRGYRATAGVSMRYPLTDRILMFGSLAHNERFAKSTVFDTRDNAAQLTLDYSLTKDSTVYVSGEYRKGDVVSTGLGSLENIDIAKVFVADDAFPSRFAYKVDAKTGIFTLGYNLSFGTRDSLDFSWRRARATPDERPGYKAAGPWHYIVDQFSVVYLVRF